MFEPSALNSCFMTLNLVSQNKITIFVENESKLLLQVNLFIVSKVSEDSETFVNLCEQLWFKSELNLINVVEFSSFFESFNSVNTIQ